MSVPLYLRLTRAAGRDHAIPSSQHLVQGEDQVQCTSSPRCGPPRPARTTARTGCRIRALRTRRYRRSRCRPHRGRHPVVVGASVAALWPRSCYVQTIQNDPVWLLVWISPGRERFLASHQTGLYSGESGGRNWIRTSDPSLVRRNLYVAGHRPVSPEAPACWTDRRLTSLCAAQCLPLVTPLWLPKIRLAALMAEVSIRDGRICRAPLLTIAASPDQHVACIVAAVIRRAESKLSDAIQADAANTRIHN